MWLNLIIVAVIVCFIVDLSGIVASIKWGIWKHLFKKVGTPDSIALKPFECSLCMVFWTDLLYLILSGGFSLPLLLEICLLSFLSKNISGGLRLVQDILIGLEDMLYKHIQKL